MKQWRYPDKTLQNSQIPFIGNYVGIIAVLCNKYRPPLCKGFADDQAVAAKIRLLSRNANSLRTHVEKEGLDGRSMRWRKVDADDGVPEFPRYNKTKLRELTLGVYNLQMARSYTQEHIDVDGKFKISVSDDIPGILSTKIQSRHVSAKQYKCWISFVEGVIGG